jgi:hypothetical protein
MNVKFGSALVALAAAVALAGPHALARDSSATKPHAIADDPARPSDSTANLPSASGAQTTTPGGAVTGLGQPQGTALKELEYGAPGGVQQRAREESVGATGSAGAEASESRRSGANDAAAGTQERGSKGTRPDKK